MKKLLLVAAVTALSATAHAAPTVYGKAFLSLDVNQSDTDTSIVSTTVDASGAKTTTTTNRSVSNKGRTQLNSNGSRVGFKGSEALSANTDLVYQLEYGVDVDADKSRNFTPRDSYMGLSHKQFGTLVAGRLTAIDDNVNYANVTVGGIVGGDDVLAFTVPRANNALAYISPEYSGVKFLGMYVMDENNTTDNLGRDAFGVGVQYEPADMPFKAGASYIQSGDVKLARVSGNYQVASNISVGALYQNSGFGKDFENENAFTVSGTYGIGGTPWNTYAQVDLVSNVNGTKDANSQRVAVGGKYAFSNQATGHLYGAYLRGESTREFAAAMVSGTEKRKFDGVGVGAGIEYKF